MNTLARTILETFIFEKKTLTPEEVEKIRPLPKEKAPVFITLYDGEEVVASTGRIYPAHNTLTEELIDNTVLLASDPRFSTHIQNTELVRKLHYRVDTFHDTDRRILHHPDELVNTTEGMILLCQKQEKVGIILPHMFKGNPSGEEVYHHLIQKTQLDTSKLGK